MISFHIEPLQSTWLVGQARGQINPWLLLLQFPWCPSHTTLALSRFYSFDIILFMFNGVMCWLICLFWGGAGGDANIHLMCANFILIYFLSMKDENNWLQFKIKCSLNRTMNGNGEISIFLCAKFEFFMLSQNKSSIFFFNFFLEQYFASIRSVIYNCTSGEMR